MAGWPYNTALWQKTRKAQLDHEPMCRLCYEIGDYTPATIVDHITRVKLDKYRAFDGSNLQSLCKPCHDRFKQAQDKGRGLPGNSKDGIPLDKGHHWNE